MPDPADVETVLALDPVRSAAVADLVGRAAAVDGHAALNDAARLQLRHPTPGVRHLVLAADVGGRARAYAQVGPRPEGAPAALVVDPADRRRGLGTALLTAALEQEPELRIWGRRGTPGVQPLADRLGLAPTRELLIMRRSLADPIPPAAPPPGIELRIFRPDVDADAWLGVNARAFAAHPEQGRITRDDLEDRMAEAWFDAAGFFVAVRADNPEVMVGFHWTKQHPERVGEVYVLGVDPAGGVRGLGRPLLARGLEHLRASGDTSVILYVEADNAPARRLYDRTGFEVQAADVQYRRATRS